MILSASVLLTMGICSLIICHCCIAIYVAHAPEETLQQTDSPAIATDQLIRAQESEGAEEGEDDTHNLCYTCCTAHPNTMLIACGHQGLCAACAARLWRIDRRCPLCRRGLNGIVLMDQ
jgi:hypothetical protein